MAIKLLASSQQMKKGSQSAFLLFFILVLGLMVGFQLRDATRNLDPIFAASGLQYNNDGESRTQDDLSPELSLQQTGTKRRPRRDTIPLEELTKSAVANILKCPDPLLPITDRVNGTIPPLVRYNIPHRIHLSWKQRCVPEDYVVAANEWRNNFPDWSFYYHDDEAVDRLLEQDWPEFPNLQKVMKACIHFGGAVKQDIWRLLVVYEYGGFYSDIDTTPGKKLNQDFMATENNEHNVSAFFLSDHANRPSQWLFAMAPRHPIAYFTLLEVLNRVLALKNVQDLKPVWVTGPDALRGGYEAFFGSGQARGKNINVLKEGLYEGPYGLWVRKYETKRNTDEFVSYTMRDEWVEYNGKNMSRKVRAEAIMGDAHWSKAIKRKRRAVLASSCWDLLYESDVDVANHLK